MKNLTHLLLVCVISGFIAAGVHADTQAGKSVTKEIAIVLKECQTIQPGMTRAEASKVFTTEGGLSTARHRTYIYRGCPYIKVDVDFTLSDPKQSGEKPTDVIAKISKPYLEWSVAD